MKRAMGDALFFALGALAPAAGLNDTGESFYTAIPAHDLARLEAMFKRAPTSETPVA